MYAFTAEDDYAKDLTERCRASLGVTTPPPGLSANFVRNVAPKKNMYRVTFRLSRDIVTQGSAVSASEAKRPKLKD